LEKVAVGRPAPAHALSDGVVTLRLPAPGDVEHFVRYGSDRSLLDGIWLVPPRGADVRAWASAYVSDLNAGWTDAGGDLGGGLIVDAAEPCIGLVNFVPRGPRNVELSYGVAPPWRRRGIASRAAALATAWALTDGDFDRVELRISEGHTVSQRVATNAGFECVERFETYVEGTGLTHTDLLYIRQGGREGSVT
jgi:RimJ/RimL family protein N-acetyltransferase